MLDLRKELNALMTLMEMETWEPEEAEYINMNSILGAPVRPSRRVRPIEDDWQGINTTVMAAAAWFGSVWKLPGNNQADERGGTKA